MSDVRSLPDSQLNLYLYAYGAWGVALLFLFAVGWLGVALSLCFVLAAFVGVLTLWWARGVLSRLKSGDLSRAEVDAAVKSVGHMLALGALTPGIVFLAQAPLQPSTWATCGSVAVIAGLTYALISLASRLSNVVGNTVALTLAWAALPLNATGAASVWAWLGIGG